MAEASWRRATRRDLEAGAAILILLAALAALAPAFPSDPRHVDLTASLTPPSLRHWLGTDVLGRDLAVRMAYGARVSLGIGLLTALLTLVIGVPVGAIAAYRRGLLDMAVTRLMETLLCFPFILLLLAFLVGAPRWLRALPDVIRLAILLGGVGWIPVARYVRAEVLKLGRSEAVMAARATGATGSRVIARHMLPQALAPALITASFAVGGAIGAEAALSFLGLGIPEPIPTWGGMLNDAREHVHRAWWLALFPGTLVFLAILGCNLVGEGLRDRLDPRSAPPF